MNKHAIAFVTISMLAGGTSAAAQGQPPRDRDVQRERRTTVERSQSREQRDEQTERFSRTLKVGANGEIMISNIAGNVTVTRGGGNDATLEVIKTARGRSTEDAKELLGLVQVDIIERGARTEIKTRYPQGDEWRRNNRRNVNVSVTYNLAAPAGTRVSVSSISGSISATDITGDLALESVSGSVRIANAGRVAAAKSISGNVEVVDTEIEGLLEASSVSGMVTIREVKARRAELGSVSGNVLVQDVTCERLEAQTVSGDVDFAGAFARNGRYELSSHSGSVRAAVAGNVGFELEATSFSGSVRSDIPLKSSSSGRGRGHQQSLEGVYGDGSAILELSTFSGSIVITKR